MSITNIKGTFIRMSECTGLIMEYSLWSNEYSIMRLVLSFPSFSRGKIMEKEKNGKRGNDKSHCGVLIMEYFFPEGKSFSRICACSEDTKCHETMHLAQSLRLLF